MKNKIFCWVKIIIGFTLILLGVAVTVASMMENVTIFQPTTDGLEIIGRIMLGLLSTAGAIAIGIVILINTLQK